MTILDIPLAYTAPSADILDRAAEVIAANGRCIGSYFANGEEEWWPGMACCVTAAIGIALGLTDAWDIENAIVPAVAGEMREHEPPHPAFAALMAHLEFDCINEVFEWSDDHQPHEISAQMRACAQALRGAQVPA